MHDDASKTTGHNNLHEVSAWMTMFGEAYIIQFHLAFLTPSSHRYCLQHYAADDATFAAVVFHFSMPAPSGFFFAHDFVLCPRAQENFQRLLA